MTDEKNDNEGKEKRAEEDERTEEVDESPSSADTCSPTPHAHQEATAIHKVTDTASEHDTLPQGEDLLATSHLYLSITLLLPCKMFIFTYCSCH